MKWDSNSCVWVLLPVHCSRMIRCVGSLQTACPFMYHYIHAEGLAVAGFCLAFSPHSQNKSPEYIYWCAVTSIRLQCASPKCRAFTLQSNELENSKFNFLLLRQVCPRWGFDLGSSAESDLVYASISESSWLWFASQMAAAVPEWLSWCRAHFCLLRVACFV